MAWHGMAPWGHEMGQLLLPGRPISQACHCLTLQYDDVCWTGVPDSYAALVGVFPDVALALGGGATLRLTPVRYLFRVDKGAYCLGVFDNRYDGTLLGATGMRHLLVTFDHRNRRVGFRDADCDGWSDAGSLHP